MDNNMIYSRKINLKKKFKLAWIVIAVALILINIVALIPYSNYRDIQEFVVNSILITSDSYDNIVNYNTMVNEMYNDLNPTYVSIPMGNGQTIDNSAVWQAALQTDYALGDLVEKAGYGYCSQGSDYLKYVGYLDYTINTFAIPLVVWLLLVLVLLFIKILYKIDQKKALIIDEDRILCKKRNKTIKEFFIKDINSVDLIKLHGLKIRGNSIKYKIILLENADEIKTIIMTYIANSTKLSDNIQFVQNTNADEIKKFKELLDAGVITQEEFDEKKKQLLNLS